MNLSRLQSRGQPAASRSGVALVVTIILLAVITFLAVAFLALSGREKGAVKVATDQTTARLAADQAVERVKTEVLATLLATATPYQSGLLVSTNFINYQGFDPGASDPSTNVNYEYRVDGTPLSLAQQQENLANLLLDPRPPVFITNRLAANSNEFRYYLDLNRNGRPDRSGAVPEFDLLGNYVPNSTNAALTNLVAVMGDPEWIGILERPGQPHSAENRFVARYAYAVVPEGNTLDINFMHNNAKGVANGFLRNQGVGAWELNLAGFLADLNTNLWNSTAFSLYTYPVDGAGLPLLGIGGTGAAFDDAYAIWQKRGGGAQASVATLFGTAGENAFQTDFVDGYSGGSVLADLRGYTTGDPDDLANRTTAPWPGADMVNRYFTTQDLWDPNKTSAGFVSRLANANTRPSTYDQYTYYRMLEQLGTDSAPEKPGKLHLNYVNVNGLTATNFVPWSDGPALQFFTNAADRLLRTYSTEWRAANYAVYTNLFRTTQPFGLTNIPVMVSNQFVYSPAIHRLLQVAANLWETQTNKVELFNRPLPTVFRPQFGVVDNNVYIRGFVEETTAVNLPIYDPNSATNLAAVASQNGGNVLMYGVPLVIGARKGLPNFNEFSMETLVTMTRKVQLRKQGALITETNQFFTMEIRMPNATEFWNSYTPNYVGPGGQPFSIYVTNFTTVTLTNDLGVRYVQAFLTGDRVLNTNNWPGLNAFNGNGNPRSFIPLLVTNLPLLPEVGYLPSLGPNFISSTNTRAFDTTQTLLMPRWGITISNRVHAMILGSGGQIIDYVLLGNLVYSTNLTDIIANTETGTGSAFEQLWATNRLGSFVSGRLGVLQQINISLGSEGDDESGEWRSYGKFSPSNVRNAIANFQSFYFSPTNGYATVPFTPTIQFRVPMSWQANDPLVHYLASDLFDIEKSGYVDPVKPPLSKPPGKLDNIGGVNRRYKPWPKEPGAASSDPNAVDPAVKDPLVRSSDEWLFPTNALPSLGWIGRIHRGTPWQTIYLKASNLGLTNGVANPAVWAQNAAFVPAAQRWASWTGNRSLEEGFYTRPVADHRLLDVFTTTLNDNSARGRLSINQTNLASWSALFSGVLVLTNTSSEDTLSQNLPTLFEPLIIPPAGAFDPADDTTWSPLVKLWTGVNATRANRSFFPAASFTKLGDILSVPELTDASPFLNRAGVFARTRGVPDPVYEWLPQQVLSLLQLGEPRFTVYAYGQTLAPAPESVLRSGSFPGLCTNYAITAEVAVRAVLRVEGSANPADTDPSLPPEQQYPPRVVQESFNFLPPE